MKRRSIIDSKERKHLIVKIKRKRKDETLTFKKYEARCKNQRCDKRSISAHVMNVKVFASRCLYCPSNNYCSSGVIRFIFLFLC